MSRKSIVVFVLAAAAVAAALVFDGISHRRKQNNDPATSQNPMIATASTDTSANSSGPGTEAQTAVPDPDGTAQAGQDAVTGDDATNADSAQPADNAPQSDADAAPPAPDPIVVPAGTTLTIRLGEELGSSISRANQRFSATLDHDVVVHGQTVIAAGATVSGRVVFAKPAGPLTGEAKLQLKVTSINVDNGNLPVVTSIRSFGPTIKGKNKVGKFMKGLVKRAAGQEREVLLAEQSACSFTLQRRLEVQ